MRGAGCGAAAPHSPPRDSDDPTRALATVLEVTKCGGDVRLRSNDALLDYEQFPKIELIINATDGYGYSLANVTVVVKDVGEPPVIDEMQNELSVLENATEDQVSLAFEPAPASTHRDGADPRPKLRRNSGC